MKKKKSQNHLLIFFLSPILQVTTSAPLLTTTPAAVTRQRLTTRLNQNAHRPHVDSVIQTRPTGSRDEYVRFSAVNQDKHQQNSFRTQNQPRTRLRTRNRTQLTHPTHVQTENDGSEYVRLQKPPSTTTTTTSTTQQPETFEMKEEEREIEYGFIRPPSFKPIHPVTDNRHTIANAVPTYKPKYEQVFKLSLQ